MTSQWQFGPLATNQNKRLWTVFLHHAKNRAVNVPLTSEEMPSWFKQLRHTCPTSTPSRLSMKTRRSSVAAGTKQSNFGDAKETILGPNATFYHLWAVTFTAWRVRRFARKRVILQRLHWMEKLQFGKQRWFSPHSCSSISYTLSIPPSFAIIKMPFNKAGWPPRIKSCFTLDLIKPVFRRCVGN